MTNQEGIKKFIIAACAILVLSILAVLLVNLAKTKGFLLNKDNTPVAVYTLEIREPQPVTTNVTGQIAEVDLKRKTVRLSTNGKNSYTGIVTADTQILRGERHVKLSEIRVGDVGTLFTIGAIDRTFEIEAIRIIENIRNMEDGPPPAASF
ncbi:MAG: hypothetical protein A2942_04150 [Candidatus Lloydbacteria bacterium RIFCSPLOWO2_01_FULL_50_20]|uniref:DUF5666 domain-containing protein n=1 Tax=Candidatus Lloydbacteria bacterium RIFCSPLOWO2_01_FULL_50_20 TaxID=1798665 RepID=A0A1G2DCJ9_9BACT|nr:MAG: hypothetical protein A3C13_01300 [Candidatus Lloydbacteria bacterium RIFCSPHIGHO2_02_FULL_50_11]OGZ11375.1 MAG: hypothetical protein A2942_04150 [Candidatus Lloydbacteria bacterium RIFCSPLOWO2_01_FULL_50_20]